MRNELARLSLERGLRGLLFAILILFVSIIFIAGCDDNKCPTCPEPEKPPELGNYRLYAWDGYNGCLMSFDTPADTLIDSIHIDYSGYNMFLTSNNRLLLLNFENWKTEILDCRDLSHIGSLDQYGDYYFDTTDGIGLYYNVATSIIYYLDPISLTPVDSFPFAIGIGNGFMDTVYNQFYVDSDSGILAIDYITRNYQYLPRPVDNTGNILRCSRIAVNWLTGDMNIIGGVGSHIHNFYIVDTASDSAIFRKEITYEYGQIALSPDGKEVYMTDPGHPIFGYIPDGNIYIFDATGRMVIDIVPPFILDGGSTTQRQRGNVIPTADGQRLYVGCGDQGAAGPVYVADLNSNRIIHTINLHDNPIYETIALGPVPR